MKHFRDNIYLSLTKNWLRISKIDRAIENKVICIVSSLIFDQFFPAIIFIDAEMTRPKNIWNARSNLICDIIYTL